ncbi:hypothetical protein BAUCODRAFT_258417 [Baudoinia panamericana UAMH 10762]|uniref:Pre-rRNA-processing protein TSR2 n=1 Tax=Baudoinia panamericana (strain UAMH 10762) TaxID=717646 RepID=M2LF76_BAUPA|nr:uncharacterized protein BAUCODRAFT_258417 [Baudoinia panamericana UAMH 10762]EMC92687.1 hypothetical protein BAUCODRAFT_258417 [Baudoinia panamericana UAMH 10762]
MSTQDAPGPSPAPAPEPSNGVPLPPTPQQLQSALDAGIWYALSLWPALHMAVQNSWGGPDSSDKKDWFAGAVSDFLSSAPDTDHEDLEVFLLQVMQDEFDCNVEDESEVEVARGILGLRRKLGEEDDGRGGLEALRELEGRWRNRGRVKMEFAVVDNGVQDEDGDGEEGEEGGWDGVDDEGDVDMDAPEDAVPHVAPVVVKEKAEPEVDEDGFTKVVGKKRR